MEKTSNECVGGPLGVNISDGFRGVTAPGSKSLASVENNSSSHGVSWRLFVGPQCLLGKVRHILGVWQERYSHPDEDCWIPDFC